MEEVTSRSPIWIGPFSAVTLQGTMPTTARGTSFCDADSSTLRVVPDRKSTRLNSSHGYISYAVFCLKKKKQCYNVLPQLDINNTIDHRPERDEKLFLETEKTVTQFCRKLAAERPLQDIRDEYNYPKKKGIKDECSRLLEASTMKSLIFFYIQRSLNAMRYSPADGCSI